MEGLPCLASQCATLHVGGWTWTVFTLVYLESCTWPVAIFTMDQRKEERVCITFCANLGKSATETLKWFNKALGTKAWDVHRCFKDIPSSRPVAHQLWTNTQGDPQVAQLLKQLHEFNSSSVRIDFGPFATFLRRWELVIGHANGFWRKNWACTMSTSALNFVSSPPTMKRSCPGSSLVMGAGFTVTTLGQSDNPPSGKVPRHQGQKRPDMWKAISRAWSSLSLISRDCAQRICPNRPHYEFRVLLRRFAVTAWKHAKTSPPTLARTDLAAHHDNAPSHTFVLNHQFLAKNKIAVIPAHRTPLIWHPVTSSYFQNWNWSWKDAGFILLRRSMPNRRECLTLWQKRTSRKRSKNGGDGGAGVYMREGTTLRVTAVDRPYGEFYDFYSVSPENFGSTHVE